MADLSIFECRYIDDVEQSLYQNFECNRQELNDFLIQDALDYHKDNITHTTLVFVKNKLIGYFSLSSDALKLTPLEILEVGFNTKYPVTYFPAVKLTKLAIHKNHSGKGYGSMILKLIEGLLYDMQLAIRFITLDAVNDEKVINFYLKNGFTESLQQANERKQQRNRATILMYKDIFAEI